MKKRIFDFSRTFHLCRIILVLSLFPVCSGCTKFDKLFDGSDPSVIEPIVEESQHGSISPFSSLVHKLGIILPRTLEKYGFKLDKDCAVVINNLNELALDSLIDDSLKNEIADIDFEHFSLIIGGFYEADTSYYVADQRAKKTLTGLELYIEIKNSGTGLAHPGMIYFAAIYPKLPSKHIVIKRWNNY